MLLIGYVIEEISPRVGLRDRFTPGQGVARIVDGDERSEHVCVPGSQTVCVLNYSTSPILRSDSKFHAFEELPDGRIFWVSGDL